VLEQREVAGAEDEFCAPIGQFVESGSLLSNECRILEDDARNLRAEPQTRRARRTSREKRPHVLVVGLIGAVASPKSQLIEKLERAQQLVERVLRKQLVAEAHPSDDLTSSLARSLDLGARPWRGPWALVPRVAWSPDSRQLLVVWRPPAHSSCPSGLWRVPIGGAKPRLVHGC
jgi:hypothetical protein